MQRLAVQKYFFENLDVFACISGIVIGTLITSLYLISKTIHLLMLGLALTFASLIYLSLLKQKNKPNNSILNSTRNIFESLFFIFFTVSLLVLYLNGGRSFLYFIIISLSAGILALSIVNIKSKIDVSFQIIKIILLSFNLKYSYFFSFGGCGIDYWAHLNMNNILVHNGFTNILPGKESSFPIMHIQVAIHHFITNTPINVSTGFAIIIPLIISSIFVFLVARLLFSAKIGLLAILIYNITDFNLYWASAPQTTSFGICLYCILIFILFNISIPTKIRVPLYTLLIIIIPSLILAHAVSSFISLCTIMGLFSGSYLYCILYKYNVETIPPIFVVFMYVIILVQNWFIAIYGDITSNSFFDVIGSSLKYYLTEHADFLNRPETIVEYAVSLPPFIERVADTSGLTILMFLAAIGSLFILSKKYRTKFTFSVVVCTIMLLFITFGFPLFGLRNIIPSRWFAFIYFFVSIIAALAIYSISTKISKPKIKVFVIFMVTILLTFFMITSTISNTDSPLWLKDSTLSQAYTFQEIAGAKTMGKYSDDIVTDSQYQSVIVCISGVWNAPLSSKDFSNNLGNIVIWRDQMKEHPIKTMTELDGYYKRIEKTIVLGDDYYQNLQKMQRVYMNGEVTGNLII